MISILSPLVDQNCLYILTTKEAHEYEGSREQDDRKHAHLQRPYPWVYYDAWIVAVYKHSAAEYDRPLSLSLIHI